MARLGSEFIIQMHVAVEPAKKESFLTSLKSRGLATELDIQATQLTQRNKDALSAQMGMRIHCVGNDRCVVSFQEFAFLSATLNYFY